MTRTAFVERVLARSLAMVGVFVGSLFGFSSEAQEHRFQLCAPANKTEDASAFDVAKKYLAGAAW